MSNEPESLTDTNQVALLTDALINARVGMMATHRRDWKSAADHFRLALAQMQDAHVLDDLGPLPLVEVAEAVIPLPVFMALDVQPMVEQISLPDDKDHLASAFGDGLLDGYRGWTMDFDGCTEPGMDEEYIAGYAQGVEILAQRLAVKSGNPDEGIQVLNRARPAMGRSFDTAPRDGTFILIHLDGEWKIGWFERLDQNLAPWKFIDWNGSRNFINEFSCNDEPEWWKPTDWLDEDV